MGAPYGKVAKANHSVWKRKGDWIKKSSKELKL